jgi:hypothetical protein
MSLKDLFLVNPYLMVVKFELWRPISSVIYTNGLFGELLVLGFYFGWTVFQREKFLGTLVNLVIFFA